MGKPQSTGNLVNAIAQDSSNNIGLGGAANASFKLQVTGTTNLTDNLTMTIASGTKSIGFGGNTIAAAANALIYSDTNYLVLNSKAGSPLYLNFDNANTSSTINMFNGKFILTQPGVATFSSPSSIIANNQGIRVYSTDSQAADLGGGISFGGYYVGTSTTADFANIKSGKDNSTSGNYAGYLAFSTNAQATGNVERMRITSGGNVLLTQDATIYNSTGNLFMRAGTSGDLILGAGGSNDKMRITSGGQVCINTTLVKSRLGTNTKFTVAGATGAGSPTSAGASMGSVAGTGGGSLDTGIDIEATDGGLTLLFLASRNTSGGTNTASAVYIISFYYSGTFPVVTYLGGTSNFVTFGQSGTSLTATNAIGYGNFNCSWFASK